MCSRFVAPRRLQQKPAPSSPMSNRHHIIAAGTLNVFDSVKKLFARRAPDRYSRRWPRVAVDEPAEVKLPNGDGKAVIVNQLSLGGARIQTTIPLKAGENIELRLEHGDGTRRSVVARIIYSLKENPGYYFACGLCFLGLKPHETQWLAALIAAEQARRRAES